MKRLALYDNWKDIVRRAWSIRFIILAGLLTGCEVVLPLFSDAIPAGLFAFLSFIAVTAAFISRIVAQKDL